MIKKIFIYLLLFGIIILLYSFFIGTKGLFIREYPIINDKIPNSFNGFKIVHFTDLHYGTTYHKKELTNLVNKINESKPDLVVFTGDLIDKNVKVSLKEKEDITKKLGNIDPLIGKYSVKGDMDENNAIYDYVIGTRHLETKEKGQALMIMFITLGIICQVLPLVFTIVVKFGRE